MLPTHISESRCGAPGFLHGGAPEPGFVRGGCRGSRLRGRKTGVRCALRYGMFRSPLRRLTGMTRGLHRYQQAGDLHFITFSCYQRRPYLKCALSRERFEAALERIRARYWFAVMGYVVMPEHVHIL